MQIYSDLIRERIDRAKRYPLMARKSGMEGSVAIQFRIAPSGALEESRILRSSGSRALDRAALKALKRASPFATFPDGLEENQVFEVEINFSLSG